MTPQEAIKELKEYNSYQKKENLLSDRITEAIDTVISAYEVSAEEIKKPDPEKYGWHEQCGFDDEPSGWLLEGGEEAYNEAVEKWKSAYQPREITDEEIAEKSRSLLPPTRDVIVNLIKISTREGYIMGATAFRDGKIKQP